jgi:hypothetical protein
MAHAVEEMFHLGAERALHAAMDHRLVAQVRGAETLGGVEGDQRLGPQDMSFDTKPVRAEDLQPVVARSAPALGRGIGLVGQGRVQPLSTLAIAPSAKVIVVTTWSSIPWAAWIAPRPAMA